MLNNKKKTHSSWMSEFAQEMEKGARGRLPSDEEFGRLWAARTQERLDALTQAGLLSHAPKQAPRYGGKPGGLWSKTQATVTFSSAGQGLWGVREWSWAVAPRLWGARGLPLWLSAPICKALAKRMGAGVWLESRLERACAEALSVYARQQAELSGPQSERPAAARALLEAREIEKSAPGGSAPSGRGARL